MTNQTIVITDDDPDIRSFVKEAMTEEGYTNVFSGGTNESLDLICREQPTVILLDIHGGDSGHGWKVLASIRSEPAVANIPIVICTTYRSIAESKAEWFASNKCTVLLKPFTLDDLLRVVATSIGPPVAS